MIIVIKIIITFITKILTLKIIIIIIINIT